jgi:hypothetical protein
MATKKAMLEKRRNLVSEYQERNAGIYSQIIKEDKPEERDKLCADLEAATVTFLQEIDSIQKQLLNPSPSVLTPFASQGRKF